jgi:calcineurin-like phosphoesterase family protein
MRMKINVDDGKNVFFISDFHFFHGNVIKFDKRPFVKSNGDPDLDTMHKTIIKNWNSVVDDNDIVFFLGDLSFAHKIDPAYNMVHALKGKIHFILGNHDKFKDIQRYNRFESINDYVDLDISSKQYAGDIRFVLMHYPIFSWNKMHHGSFMIHGHCHGNLHHGEHATYYDNRKAIDVGCNLLDYTPISYTEIIKRLNK